VNIPIRPASPRPGGVPYWITSRCTDCGGPLELHANNDNWNDEFHCPNHDGLYLDVPENGIIRGLLERWWRRAKGGDARQK
jgi:Rieske Fe-S protein